MWLIFNMKFCVRQHHCDKQHMCIAWKNNVIWNFQVMPQNTNKKRIKRSSSKESSQAHLGMADDRQSGENKFSTRLSAVDSNNKKRHHLKMDCVYRHLIYVYSVHRVRGVRGGCLNLLQVLFCFKKPNARPFRNIFMWWIYFHPFISSTHKTKTTTTKKPPESIVKWL